MKVNEIIIAASETIHPIVAQERETYREVYDLLEPTYGTEQADSPGYDFSAQFRDIVGEARGTILDAGCGAGLGAVALAEAGFTIAMMCDLIDVRGPAAQAFPFREACLWHALRPQLRLGTVDWVYSCDVLEHLPTQFVALAIDQMLRVATRGVFLSVMLKADKLGVFVGKPLHQTIRPYRWWRDTCRELGRLTDARDLGTSATFYLEPAR